MNNAALVPNVPSAGEVSAKRYALRRAALLVIATVLFVVSLFLLHSRYGPRPVGQDELANRRVLHELFEGQDEVVEQGRLVFASLSALRGDNPSVVMPPTEEQRRLLAAAKAAGAEDGEVEVGLYASYWRKETADRAAMRSSLRVRLPQAAGLSALMGLFAEMDYSAFSNLRRDFGLEDFSSSWSFPRAEMLLKGLRVDAQGHREGDLLRMTIKVYQGGRELLAREITQDIGVGGVPVLDPSPFRIRKRLRESEQWIVTTLQTDPASLVSGQMRWVRRRLRVAEWGKTMLGGKSVSAFRVVMEDERSEAGTTPPLAWAWYSLDGRVLKEHWPLLGQISVTLVSLMPEELENYQVKIGRSKASSEEQAPETSRSEPHLPQPTYNP
jgi:hypothetical protein